MAQKQFDPAQLKSIPSLSDLIGMRASAADDGLGSGQDMSSPGWWDQFRPVDGGSQNPGGQGQSTGASSIPWNILFSDAHQKAMPRKGNSASSGQTMGPPPLHSDTGQYMGAYRDQATQFSDQYNNSPDPLGHLYKGAQVATDPDVDGTSPYGIHRINFTDGSQAVVTPRHRVVPAKIFDRKTPPVPEDDVNGTTADNAELQYASRGMDPDYGVINAGQVALPQGALRRLGLGPGFSGQLIVDRYGNVYTGGGGGGAFVPKEGMPKTSFDIKGISAAAGWVDRRRGVPSEKDLMAWLAGNSANLTIGAGLSAGITGSKGNHGIQPGYEIGVGTKGVSGSIGGAHYIGKVPWMAWDHSTVAQQQE